MHNLDSESREQGQNSQAGAAEQLQRHNFHNIAEQKVADKKTINDDYYDARLKNHNFRGRKQTVIIFSNVTAVKQLEQERVIKDFTRIMTASNYHEFRTPIGAGLNALMLLRSSITPE